jgi:arylformamidase
MTRLVLAALVASAAGAQTAPRVERNIAYAQPATERNLLDVYAPASGAKMPVVVWVHGGGWMRSWKRGTCSFR